MFSVFCFLFRGIHGYKDTVFSVLSVIQGYNVFCVLISVLSDTRIQCFLTRPCNVVCGVQNFLQLCPRVFRVSSSVSGVLECFTKCEACLWCAVMCASVPQCCQASHNVQIVVAVYKCARVGSSVSQSVMEMGQRRHSFCPVSGSESKDLI